MVAVVVSMLLLIRRAAHPHVAFLGRIPGTRMLLRHASATRTTRPCRACWCSASRRRCSTSTSSTCATSSGRKSARRTGAAEAGGMRSVHFAHRRPRRRAHAGDVARDTASEWAYACGSSRRMRRCATCCAPKDWRSASATSAAGSRWPMSSTSSRAAQERGTRRLRQRRPSSVHVSPQQMAPIQVTAPIMPWPFISRNINGELSSLASDCFHHG